MSYKALYRKYRPQTLNDVVGQDHIVTTLKNILASQKISHAYLFAGPRGTGKTSVAHIFANEVNKKESGESGANKLDIIEIDAASNNGVAEIRTLIEGSKYAPSSSKYKVYIIDEVHMLTKGAFNALLKTLEEPPTHVLFILATTEPEKVPITILSRLQRFDFKKIDKGIIENKVIEILESEAIKYDQESISLISTLARGAMRDALSIADQVAAYSNNSISFETVSKVFGIISIEKQIEFMNKVFLGKTAEFLLLIDTFISSGINLSILTTSLVNTLRDFIVFKKTSNSKFMDTLNEDEVSKMEISLEFAYKASEEIMPLIQKIKTSMIPRYSFELAILRISGNDIVAIDEVPMKNETNVEEKEDIVEDADVSNKIEEDVFNKIFETNITEEKVDSQIKSENKETGIISESIQEKDDKDKGDLPNDQNIDLQDLINTDELELTTEMNLKTQELQSEADVIENEILSTQEINLKEVTSNNDEIDLVSMFDTQTNKVNVIKTNNGPNVDEIINLLIQSNKEMATIAKEKIESSTSLSEKNNFRSYVSLFAKVKLISRGKNFVLLTSQEDAVVKQIVVDGKRQSFIDFAAEVFDEPTAVFAITKEEFENIKVKYQELASSGSLPETFVVEAPLVSEPTKTKEEEYGADLFGSIFE